MVMMAGSESPATATQPRDRAGSVWVYRLVVLAIATVAVALIVFQQLHRTPWGLPGHRGLFWLSTLIAVRWCIDRPGVALRVAAVSSCALLITDATLGTHVLSYLAAGLLVDRAADTMTVRRHPWVMLLLAPLILLVNLLSPFLRNLGLTDPFAVVGGMWFYIKGHLLWGTAAGFVGMGIGVPGRRLLRRIEPSPPPAAPR